MPTVKLNPALQTNVTFTCNAATNWAIGYNRNGTAKQSDSGSTADTPPKRTGVAKANTLAFNDILEWGADVVGPSGGSDYTLTVTVDQGGAILAKDEKTGTLAGGAVDSLQGGWTVVQ